MNQGIVRIVFTRSGESYIGSTLDYGGFCKLTREGLENKTCRNSLLQAQFDEDPRGMTFSLITDVHRTLRLPSTWENLSDPEKRALLRDLKTKAIEIFHPSLNSPPRQTRLDSPRKSRILTEEHKEKIRQANRGRVWTEEQKAARREAFFRSTSREAFQDRRRQPKSEETKAKIRDSTSKRMKGVWAQKKSALAAKETEG